MDSFVGPEGQRLRMQSFRATRYESAIVLFESRMYWNVQTIFERERIKSKFFFTTATVVVGKVATCLPHLVTAE